MTYASTRGRQSGDRADSSGRYPMPSHTKGQYHARLPRRLRPRDPGRRARTRAGRRLDQGIHERRRRSAPSPGRATIANTTKLAGDQQEQPEARAVRRRRRSSAGSSRRRRTGRTSRTRSCSRTCSVKILTGRTSVQERGEGAASKPDHADPQRLVIRGREASCSSHERALPGRAAACGRGAPPPRRRRRACAGAARAARRRTLLARCRRRRHRRRARLSALPAGPALLPAVRPAGADRRTRASWIGVDNYTPILHDSEFWRVARADGRLHRGERLR